MKRHWDEHDLGERWSLTHDEFDLLRNRTDQSRIGFAVLLKFFQVDGRFPNERREVPGAALDYVAAQVAVSPEKFSEYEFGGRSCEQHSRTFSCVARQGCPVSTQCVREYVLRRPTRFPHRASWRSSRPYR